MIAEGLPPAAASGEVGPAGDVPECPFHPKLLAAGWVRRFLVGPERAAESMAIYEAMGLEVRAEQLRPEEFGPACVGCSLTICRDYVVLYTRNAER